MSLYSKIIDIQKLYDAWKKIKKNKPACGVDNVSFEAFDSNIKQEIKQLNIELSEHTYEPLPVKMVVLKREGKMRDISLYSMRDKVVQASIAQELTKIYDRQFSNCVYAYRNDQSALNAIDVINIKVQGEKYKYFLKTDIEKFFDNINIDKLRMILSIKIKEEDTLDLIISQLKTPSVDDNGELIEKRIGIYQGSGISPILSNIYMERFDQILSKEDIFYARYADDIVVLADTKEKIESLFVSMRAMVEDLGLRLNEEKTHIGKIEEGFDYLGYHFDATGKSIPAKAYDKMQTSLEDVWLTMTGSSIEEKLKKGSQIINGWEQYYKGEREITNIYEYVELIYMTRYKGIVSELCEKRSYFVNCIKEITEYLSAVWKENNRKDLVIYEYEQYFEVDNGSINNIADKYINEVIGYYENLVKYETEDDWSALLQTYSDMGMYEVAEKITDRINKLKNSPKHKLSIIANKDISNEINSVNYDFRTLELMERLFVGREDMYCREILDSDNKRKSEYIPEPLTREVIKNHLEGIETIGTYLARVNDTVHYVVFDIDISRKLLLSDPDKIDDYLLVSKEYVLAMKNVISDMGIRCYVEFSGYRGYHIWIFFDEWIPIRYAYSLEKIICEKTGKIPDELTLECFPVNGRKKSGSSAQRIKLPYALHLISGKRSFFCEDDFESVNNINEFLSCIATYSLSNIKRVIGANMESTKNEQISTKSKIELEYDKFENLSEAVIEVLEGCTLMRYLVNKAVATGYLSHFERLSILHVFGHLGDSGKEFVHSVMRYTLNYQPNITQRFIDKCPGKPVSCIKLREQYKQITAEYGCSCMFKRTKDCYPSPVIHALKNGEENHDVTIPISKTITQNKKERVYQELNIRTKIQENAEKLIELKKQGRNITKAVDKIERELNILFDNACVDCMEVDVGMLVRRKKEQGYEWIIEI